MNHPSATNMANSQHRSDNRNDHRNDHHDNRYNNRYDNRYDNHNRYDRHDNHDYNDRYNKYNRFYYLYDNRFDPIFTDYLYDKPFNRKCVLDLLARRGDNNVTSDEIDNLVNLCNLEYGRGNNYVTISDKDRKEGFVVADDGLIVSLINLIIIVFLILVLCHLLKAL